MTPLILSYVNKYVKNIRPEDSQLSLWGGDAVFNNLDLRLDELEQELNIPFSLINGHIHELRIHVPWTKLTSEPVVITVNTIECVLCLRDGATSSATSSSASSSSKLRRVSRQLSSPDGSRAPPSSPAPPPPPSGYLGSLLRRVLHNITIVLNNVIFKYAEDDLVLSLNIKAVEATSAGAEWKPAFVEVSLEEPVLRKLLWMHDVTVCLDKRDSSGKIEAYQDPLLYRCFLEGRVHLGYDPGAGSSGPPTVTRCHFSCHQLDFSLTDQQLPLFLRLLELCLALYYGRLPHAQRSTDGAAAPVEASTETSGSPPGGEDGGEQSWGSWAWSLVPQILPAWEEEEDGEEREGMTASREEGVSDAGLRPYESSLLHVGCYVEKLTCVFKTTKEAASSRRGASRPTWRPLLVLQLHGAVMEMTVRGLTWIHFQLGIVGATVGALERCTCGFDEGTGLQQEQSYLRAGVVSGSHTYGHLTSSLFDPTAPENGGSAREPEPTLDAHVEQLTELAMAERFPAFCLDYLYELQIPEDWCDLDCELDAAFLEASNWKERSLCRSVIGPFTVDVSTGFVHRFRRLLDASRSCDSRPPYAVDEPERLPFPQPFPEEEQLESMATFVPTRTYRLTILKPTVKLLPTTHSAVDASRQRPLESKKRSRLSTSFQDDVRWAPTAIPVLALHLECVDVSLTRPMYPGKMAAVASAVGDLYGLPDLVKHHGFCHLTAKVFGFGSDLVLAPALLPPVALPRPAVQTTLLEPTWATFYRSWSASPSFLAHQPRWIRMRTDAALGPLHFAANKQAAMVAWGVALSWSEGPQITATVGASSLLGDLLHEGGGSVDALVTGVKWTCVKDSALTAHAVEVAAIAVKLNERELSTYILNAPEDTKEVANFTKMGTATVGTCDEPWLKATVQVSQQWSEAAGPNFVQLELRGLVLNLDPVIATWFSDLPAVLPVGTALSDASFSSAKSDGGAHVFSDEPLEGSASGSQSQRSHRLSDSHATSPPPRSVLSSVAKQTPKCPDPKSKASLPWGVGNFRSWLLGTYHRLRIFSVQVNIGSVGLLFPRTARLLAVPRRYGTNRALVLCRWKELAQSTVNNHVMCALLPSVTVKSTGSKAAWDVGAASLPLTELPDGVAACSEKFPWSVQLASLTAFEARGSQLLYALKPSSLSCTVALSVGDVLPGDGSPPGSGATQLRLCVHLDVEPFHLSLSKKQLNSVCDVVQYLFSLHRGFATTMAWFRQNVSADCLQSAAAPVEPSQKTRPASRTASLTESEDPSASASALPSLPEGGPAVALSLWLQWTLPKFGVNLFGKEEGPLLSPRDIWLQLEAEEVTASLDVQDIYSKAKLKMDSLTISCFEKSTSSPSWEPGMYEGVVLSSAEKLTRYTTVVGASHVGSKAGAATASPAPGNKGKPAEFLNFTWTRALRAHVRRNVHKPRKDFTPLTEAERRAATRSSSSPLSASCYLSEVDMQVSPLDVVVLAPIIRLLLDTSESLGRLCELVLPPPAPREGVEPSRPVGWHINSSTLPLVYLRTGTIRIFLPQSSRLSSSDNSRSHCLDTCLAQVGSVSLSPQVENPLSRRILREDLFSWAQEHRLLATLGSNIEDRQYQLDLAGLLVCTLRWDDMVAHLQASACRPPGAHPCTAIMGENPAFEWNHQPSGAVAGRGAPERPVPLTPVTSWCDLRVMLAPAIVTVEGTVEAAKEALVCAHSIEASIACDLHCYMSLDQVSLLHRVTSEIAAVLSGPFPSTSYPRPPYGPASNVSELRDSGLDSDLSTSVDASSANAHRTYRVPSAPSLSSAAAARTSCAEFVPFDILLTAGTVSLTLGLVEECRGDSTSAEELKAQCRERIRGSPTVSDDEDDLGYDASEDSDSRTETDPGRPARARGRGRSKVAPAMRLVLSQPHAFISCSPHEQRVEISCFDLQVGGAPPGTTIRGSSLASIESWMVFSTPWLETRPGEPDSKTGIPPSLFTVSVRDFLSDLVQLSVKVERPFKVSLSESKMEQALGLAEHVLRQLALPSEPEPFPAVLVRPGASAKPTPAATWRLKTTVETVQAMFVLDFPSPQQESAKLVVSSEGHRTNVTVGCSHIGTPDTLRAETSLEALQFYAVVNKERCSLAGPTAVSFSADTFWDHQEALGVPHCVLRLHSEALLVYVGPLQIHCCRAAVDHVMHLAEMVAAFVKRAPPSEVADAGETETVPSGKPENRGVSWCDDLRKGSFQYIQDYGIPNPNEIVFCRPSDGDPGMMTWRYPEPRVLTRVDVYPVPFSTSRGDEVAGAKQPVRQIECDLQYWDPCQERFSTYQRFELSECTPHSLQLPPPSRDSEHLLIVSDTWRVVLLPTPHSASSEDGSYEAPAAVSPLALAACMRVDSHFDPCLVPLLRVCIAVGVCKMMCSVPYLPPVIRDELRTFVLDDPPVKFLDLVVLTFDDFSLSHTGWHHKANVEAQMRVSCDATELLYLTRMPILDPVGVRATLVVCQLPDRDSSTEVNVAVDQAFLKISQAATHTMLTAAALWKQDKHGTLPAYIVICNDVQETIRFGQVDTDESIALRPGHMCAYAWRSHKVPRLLRLSVESQSWKWSTPYCPHGRDDNSEQVVKISRRLGTVALCIRTKRNRGVETQVIVSGQVRLRSHLVDRLQIRLWVADGMKQQSGSQSNSSPQQKAIVASVPVLNGRSPGTSLLVDPAGVQKMCVRRETSQSWSAEINVRQFEAATDWAEIVEILDPAVAGGVLRVWCYGFKRRHEGGGGTVGTDSLVLALAPVYILRSHLPFSLLVHLEKQEAGDSRRETLEVQGRGQDHVLPTASPAGTTTLTFQLGPDMKVSSPPVHLDRPKTGVPPEVPPEILDFLYDPTWPGTSPDPVKWPYHDPEVTDQVNDLWEKGLLFPQNMEGTSLQGPSEVPETELRVVQYCDPRLPFTSTVVVDVKPWAIVVNQCGCSFRLHTSGRGDWLVAAGQVFTPPMLQEPFRISMEGSGRAWMCDTPLAIGRELLQRIAKVNDPQHWPNKVVELAVGEVTRINIIMGEDGTSNAKKVCKLVADVQDVDGCLVIAVRSAVYVVDQVDASLRAGGFVVPYNSPYMEQWTGDKPVSTWCALTPSCDDGHGSSVALLTWEIANVDQSPSGREIAFDTGLLFLTLSQDNPEDVSEQGVWSLPVPVMLQGGSSSSDARHTTAVPTARRPPYTTLPVVVTTHSRHGCLYVVVSRDASPLLRISNATQVTLQFAEASDEADGSSQAFLSSVPSGCSVHFTPPSLSRRCTTGLGHDVPCPTLYFAHLNDGPSSEDSDGLWSSPVNCGANIVNQFVRVPSLGDVRVSACRVGHTIDLLVQSVSRAEVSAKEIRSRIGESGAARIARRRPSDHSSPSATATAVRLQPVVIPEPVFEQSAEPDAVTALLKKTETEPLPTWARILTFASVNFRQTCIVLSDDDAERSAVVGPVEILRLGIDELSCVLRQTSGHAETPHLGIKYELFVFAANFQLDNQLAGNTENGVYDFPVVAVPQEATLTAGHVASSTHNAAVVSLTLSFDVLPCKDVAAQSLTLKLQPTTLCLEDGLLYRVMQMRTFLRMSAAAPPLRATCDRRLPKEVLVASMALAQVVPVREVTVEAIALRLSVHASLKLFLSLNGTPLSFARFSRTCTVMSCYQLGQLLTRHYVTGALFRAGWVVGSLDLLGNPAGLVQAIGSGVSALVVLPFRGLARGRPWAFFLGVSHGTSAMFRHISSGALSSVTQLATSVSRNLDWMSLDSNHLAWKESLRTGSSQGFTQGLSTLGLSLLGAVAGIVDHPMQALISEEERGPSGFVKGVGKGLIGVVAKPIGGAAELVAQTGKGILRGTGWGMSACRRYEAEKHRYQDRANSDAKLQAGPVLGSGEFLLSTRATHNFDGERSQAVVLVLTSECLCIFSEGDDTLERSFSVAEVTCVASRDNPPFLVLGLESQCEMLHEEPATRARVRVAEYVTKASQFAGATYAVMQHDDNITGEGSSRATTTSEPSLGVAYRFSVDPKLRPLFLARVREAKRMALGKGFGLP